jgi:hypothetical protein
MNYVSYGHVPYPVRTDITEAHQRAWQRLAAPGNWFSGAERVAIMAESRHAMNCGLCRQRKAALSPYAIEGDHDSPGVLSATIVEIIHRIRTDSGRLTQSWYQTMRDSGVSDGEYVETVGVVASTVAIDTFARGLGIAPLPLPEPVAGEPSRYRPPGARPGRAWVPMIAPRDAAGAEADLYAGMRGAHIQQALTLVPNEMLGFFDIAHAQYLSSAQMRDFDTEYRAISHAQIELVAGRVSAVNQCVY